MPDPFLNKLTTLRHWGRLFNATQISKPIPLWAIKHIFYWRFLFFFAFLDSPLNDETWSKILLILSVPLKTIQSLKHFWYSFSNIYRFFLHRILRNLYIKLAQGTHLIVLRNSDWDTIILVVGDWTF